jgi:hypothetical protein
MNTTRNWKQLEQALLYVCAASLMAWDLFANRSGIWGYDPIVDRLWQLGFIFLLAFLSLILAAVLSFRNAHKAARVAFFASAIGLAFYLVFGATNYLSRDAFFFFTVRVISLGIAGVNSQWIIGLSTPRTLPKSRRFNFRWTSARYRVVFILSFALLAVISSLNLAPYISCKLEGDEWVRGGLAQAYHCVHEYPDGGQVCTSSDQCLGGCMVYDWPGEEPPQSGTCKPNNSPFGCRASIENWQIFVCAD